MQQQEVWILDDERELADTYAELLSPKYRARTFSSPAQALKAFESGEPDLFVTDMKMPEMNGIDLIEKLRKDAKETPVILVSGYAEKEHLVSASNAGISGFLEKPLEASHLLSMVDKTLTHAEAHANLKHLNSKLTERCAKLDSLCNRYFDRLARAENLLDQHNIPLFATEQDKLNHLLNLALERTLNEDVRRLRLEADDLGRWIQKHV